MAKDNKYMKCFVCFRGVLIGTIWLGYYVVKPGN